MTDADITEILSAAADESSPCARVLRFHEDLHVAVRPQDFYQALKADPAVVVRIETDDVVPIDCRFRNGAVEFTTDQLETKVVGRNQFLDDVSDADEITIIHHSESQFEDAQEIRTDGGTATSDTYCRNCGMNLNDPKNAGFPFDGDWYCSGFCAEVSAGFWSRGNDVSDYNSQLAERSIDTDTDRDVRCDGGISTSGTERPPFIDPHTDWIGCYLCGQVISDMSRVEGIDISAPDEYYPKMVPVCPGHETGGDA